MSIAAQMKTKCDRLELATKRLISSHRRQAQMIKDRDARIAELEAMVGLDDDEIEAVASQTTLTYRFEDFMRAAQNALGIEHGWQDKFQRQTKTSKHEFQRWVARGLVEQSTMDLIATLTKESHKVQRTQWTVQQLRRLGEIYIDVIARPHLSYDQKISIIGQMMASEFPERDFPHNTITSAVSHYKLAEGAPKFAPNSRLANQAAMIDTVKPTTKASASVH